MKMTVNYPPSSVGVADAHSFHNIQLEKLLLTIYVSEKVEVVRSWV